MKAERVGNYQAQWGEGPIWWQDQLLHVDIENHRVVRWKPGADEQIIETGERVGLVVPRANASPGNDLLIAGDNGFAFLADDGTRTPIADPEPDIPENRFNDGKCDPQGRLWAGTIATTKLEGTAKLYCLEAGGSVTSKYGPVTNSNGICWSLDGTRLYYIDTPTKEVLVFPFEGETGTIGKPQIHIDTCSIDGSPDGMTIDSEGHLWVAFCRGGAVRRFDGETGDEMERVDLPCSGVTAPAFGGEDLGTLYITTGQFKDPEQGAGYLFAADVGVSGIPATPFAG